MVSIWLRPPARALALLAALPVAWLGCGADTLISGIGNSGNMIGVDVLERVAHELAHAKTTPAVSDDDLRASFSAIREHAVAGDPDAALVLLRVAALQRAAAEKQ
jgi:hypothetical protein